MFLTSYISNDDEFYKITCYNHYIHEIESFLSVVINTGYRYLNVENGEDLMWEGRREKGLEMSLGVIINWISFTS